MFDAAIKHSLGKILDHLRKSDEQVVKDILSHMGIRESDECYETLKTDLHRLIGKKAREKDFSEFFRMLSSQLYRKIRRRERELRERVRDETVQELRDEVTRSKEQLIAEISTKAFSPSVFTIIDRTMYEILKLLYEGERHFGSLERNLNLRNKNDLIWRLGYLKDLGFLEVRYLPDGQSYRLSDVGRSIFMRRGTEFGKLLDLLVDDEIHQLSLKAVGGRGMMAEKLEAMLQSGRLRGHMPVIEHLRKECTDPKELSQAFFGGREKGDRHKKHFGIKIVDHQAAGELLLLALEKRNFQVFKS